MRAINIVIVDDHKIFLEGLTSVLSKQNNIEILAVLNTGEEALKFLKSEKPNLLITDISMPDINGLELIKAANKMYPDLKILVISMFQQFQPFNNIKGYLLKETSFDELIKAINIIVLENGTYFYRDYIKSNDELEFKKSLLTSREKEIIGLISQEFSTEQMAAKLFISKHTIEAHKKNIFLKLKVHNSAGLIKKAMYLGYL